MEDPSGAPDGNASKDASSASKLHEVIAIAADGDIVLDVTFETSKQTLKAARKAQPRFTSRGPPPPAPKAKVRQAYRVALATLRKQSKYFDKLLGEDGQFREARDVSAAHAALAARQLRPADAEPQDLPWIAIHDDDEATRLPDREGALADLLRVLHGGEATAPAPVTMPYVATLAVLADRFDCAAAVSRYVATGLKLKWPVTGRRSSGGGGGDETRGLSRTAENVLRQKILVAWVFNLPGKFQTATRELIMNGSWRWSTLMGDEGNEEDEGAEATWWYLQDGLEEELQYRRHCILNTIASVQQHFLSLYASRGGQRQCTRGYDSSASCDSYQLGEMVRFLVAKRLLFLADFGPSSLAALGDAAVLPVDGILATLRQVPAYQIDAHHTNCGLRTRILPLLDFIAALLSANSLPLSRASWKADGAAASWARFAEAKDDANGGGKGAGKPFRFTRSLAGDQRLRFENAMGADKFARDVFTASSWDWTADENTAQGGIAFSSSSTPRWSLK
ncbi:hypothetical protein F4780DRAFT_722775 [Xylariomycetidae sp. FL0641]|nr:hypothetical protein F4780DRAFT_722775 [Xylariomycetidae sp. FL0641]